MKYTFLFSFFILLLGCRTSSGTYNHVTTQDFISASSENNIKFRSAATLDSLLSKYRAKIKIVEKFYSEPDSNGLQSVLFDRVYDMDIETENKNIEISSDNEFVSSHQDSKSALNVESEENSSHETEYDFFNVPLGFKIFVLLVFILLLYKKYAD